MIEAVNAAVANAQVLRGNTDAVAVANSFAANPERVQQALPQAPYVSPYIFVDVNFDKAVLQIRDGDTGDVVRQFPSETTLALQAHHAASESATSAPVVQSDAPTPAPAQAQAAQVDVAAAQAAAAALARGAQAAVPQIATVVTSA